MKLNDVTANSMNWLAISIFLVGMMIPSPAGGFFLTIVAIMVALVPLLFSRAKKRIIAGMIVAAAVIFTCATFAGFQKDYNKYLERVRISSPALKP